MGFPMLSILLIPFYLLSSYTNHDHAFYISILEIDEQQMSIKIFSDNLEDAIRNDSKAFTPSDEEAFPIVNRSAINGYFQKKIQLQINGQKIGFSLDTIKMKGNSYWVTFRLEAQEEWQSFYLKASYFMELFPDQTTIVKVISKKPQIFKLTNLNPSCEFTL
ncbi:MAG: DUF6702 family protein [Bacteroidota bacterium]